MQRSESTFGAAKGHRFSVIEWNNPRTNVTLKFVITKAPNDSNVDAFIAELQRLNVKDVVRVCQPTYDKDYLKRQGITVHDLYFNDGKTPPPEVINSWLSVVQHVFYSSHSSSSSQLNDTTSNNNNDKKNGPGIAVHCVAGLGRAPVMVALALMEDGMSNTDVIQFIRSQAPGSFNNHQIKFLMSYVPKKKKCIVM